MRDQKKTLQRSEVPNISAFRCGHRKYATRNKTTLRRSGVPARHADQKKNLTRTGKKKTPLQKNLSAFRVASGNVRPEKKNILAFSDVRRNAPPRIACRRSGTAAKHGRRKTFQRSHLATDIV